MSGDTIAALAAARPLSVVYVAVAALKPDPRNARTHPKRQIDQIVSSIREFGFTNPVLIDPDLNLIAGHGRLIAAKAMGVTEVPTITLADLSDAQKRALRIADNKIALGAGWDLDVLKVELAELSVLDVDLDLTVTGFSTGEIDVMMTGAADPDDDGVPPLPSEPRTKPGDIWALGDHRVGCGDGRDPDFLRAVVGKGAIGAVKPNAPLISYLVRALQNASNFLFCSHNFRPAFSSKPVSRRLGKFKSNQILVSLTVPSDLLHG